MHIVLFIFHIYTHQDTEGRVFPDMQVLYTGFVEGIQLANDYLLSQLNCTKDKNHVSSTPWSCEPAQLSLVTITAVW